MSELVGKVALAIAIVMVERKRGSKVNIPPEDKARAEATPVAEVGDEARAAIRAVLAHFSEAGNVSARMMKAAFAADMDHGNARVYIAAAMAAALKEMEP